MFINHKIFDSKFHLLGATGVGIKTSYINDMLKQFRLKYNFNVYFINDVGEVIISELSVNTTKNINDIPALEAMKVDLISKGTQLFEYTHNDKTILLNRKYIPELDLFLIVEAKMDDFTQKVTETFYFNIIISLLLTVGITVIMLVYVKNIHVKLNLLADNDPLTKLSNRRFFKRKFKDTLRLKKRKNLDLSVLFIDLDNFKEINDTKGHDVGDKVLKRVASILNTVIKNTDYSSRWGGEEFIILLTDSDIETAQSKASELCEMIKHDQHLINFIGHKLTASLGITEVKNDDNIDGIYKRIDGALYKAKSLGKNQYVVG